MMKMMLKLYVPVSLCDITSGSVWTQEHPVHLLRPSSVSQTRLVKTIQRFHSARCWNTVVNSGLWLSFDSTIITFTCSQLQLMNTWRRRDAGCPCHVIVADRLKDGGESVQQPFGCVLLLPVSETGWLIFVKDEAADGVSGCT